MFLSLFHSSLCISPLLPHPLPYLSLSLPPFCPLTALIVAIRKPFVFFPPKQHMHARTVSGPFIPKAAQGSGVPRSLWRTGHCGQSYIGQAAQRGGMWVSVANDTLVLFPEGQADWQLVPDRSQEGNCHPTLSLYLSVFPSHPRHSFFLFLPPPFLSPFLSPSYFPSPTHLLAPTSPPQPAFSL